MSRCPYCNKENLTTGGCSHCGWPNNLNTEKKTFEFKGGFKPDNNPFLMPQLTKRDLFAAMAMQGFLAMNQPSEERGKEAPNIISKASVIMADALIAELDKEGE